MKTRLLSLLLVLTVGLFALSCGTDSTPTGPAPTAATPAPSALLDGITGGLIDGITRTVNGLLLSCSPLPYAKDVETIGPYGGTLQAGPHTLVIPPGALSAGVVITMDAPVGTARSVRLMPEGLQFNPGTRAVLSLSYQNCRSLLPIFRKKVAYTDNLLNILQLLPSI